MDEVNHEHTTVTKHDLAHAQQAIHPEPISLKKKSSVPKLSKSMEPAPGSWKDVQKTLRDKAEHSHQANAHNVFLKQTIEEVKTINEHNMGQNLITSPDWQIDSEAEYSAGSFDLS